jgi:predicted RNA-binding protein with PUA domain
MLETLKKFFNKDHKIVEQGFVWRCTKCNLVFLTRTAGEQHDCRERI